MASKRRRKRTVYDRPQWAAKKRAVRQRSGGLCERCCEKPARHVHHLIYSPKGIGHEPLEWLQHVCLDCHSFYHPDRRFLTNDETKHRQREKERGEAACRHCGGTWPIAKHFRICVRHGLTGSKREAKPMRFRERLDAMPERRYLYPSELRDWVELTAIRAKLARG